MDFLFLIHLVNGLLMLGMPVGLAVFLTRRFHLGWGLVWIGAATFILSQAGHIPFNLLLTRLFQWKVLPSPPVSWAPYFNPIVLGLSAGLFEELSRTAVYAWWAKDARSWRKGLLLGAGHGGVEAFILGLVAMYGFIQLVQLRGMDLTKVFAADQLAAAQQQVASYWSAPWTEALLGALERFFAIPFHLFMSVLVLQAFTRRQAGWVVLAVFWHALVDASSVYMITAMQGLPRINYAVEGLVALLSIIGVILMFRLRQPEPMPVPLARPEVAPPIATEALNPVEMSQKASPDKLDDSKYL